MEFSVLKWMEKDKMGFPGGENWSHHQGNNFLGLCQTSYKLYLSLFRED